MFYHTICLITARHYSTTRQIERQRQRDKSWSTSVSISQRIRKIYALNQKPIVLSQFVIKSCVLQ